MRLQHIETQHFARPISQQLPDGNKIAFGLRHLVAFDLQEAVVHPDAGHAGFVEGAAALREFVLVMGKHQIDAAAMDIELLGGLFPRYYWTLDVPGLTVFDFVPLWRRPLRL